MAPGWLLLAGIVLVVGSGFRLAVPALDRADVTTGRALPPPAATTAPPSPSVATSPLPPPVVTDPSRLRIPAIALDAPVVSLGLTPQGAIDVPTKWGDVGWYSGGVAPGAVGPAVLVGHYDSTSGPAVFYRLRSLLPGDLINVVSPTGRTVTFTVDRTQSVTKATFPTGEIYGPVTRPEIRVITCDGGFDEHTHHYLNNLVVYGHAVGGTTPGTAVPPATPPAATRPTAAEVRHGVRPA